MENVIQSKNVEIRQVNKWYSDEVHAVIDMEMEINKGEFIVFVGPSGCGKTTLLRMIAGLEDISSGEIIIDNKLVNKVPPKNRDIAMVFQNYALYPTMKVKENIAFPLKMHRIEKRERARLVDEVAKKLELDALLERKPGALSGGQRQRVALARAMVRKPKLFLMDEPLSNLDAKLRTEMRREIVTLQRDLGVTTIYVTHDQTEAMTMGNRIAVLNNGVLQQIGTPQEIYCSPANLFVAGFIGAPNMNIWDTRTKIKEGQGALDFGLTDIIIPPTEMLMISKDVPLKAGIRPEHIELADPRDKDAVCLDIRLLENTGREVAVFFETPGYPDLTMITSSSDFGGQIGQSIPVKLKKDKIHIFNAKTGQLLNK